MSNKFTLYISTTRSCNLGCSHCFQGKSHKNPDDSISFDRTIDFIVNNSFINNITILGGEAFVDIDRVEKILDAIMVFNKTYPEHKKIVNFITNGTIYWDGLVKYKDFIGNVQFSIDGGHEYHDSIRAFRGGAGSWDVCIANLFRYKADGFKCSVHSVYHPKLIDKFISTMPNLMLAIGQKTPIGFEAVRGDKSVSFFDELISTAKMYKFINQYHKLGCLCVGMRGRHGYSGIGSSIPCHSGSSFLGLDSVTGNLYACHEKVTTGVGIVGNILSEPAIDIVKFEESVSKQLAHEYYIHGLPKFLGKFILRHIKLQICWQENEDMYGDWRVIPAKNIVKYIFASVYNFREKVRKHGPNNIKK